MTSRLRVLHIIGGLQCGGAETLLYRLVTRQSQFDHEIVSLAGRDWYTPLLERDGVIVHHLNVHSLLSGGCALPRLRQLIARSHADVIQSWMYKSNILAGLLARRRMIPVVWGIHTSTFEGTGLASRVAARIGGFWAPKLTNFVINCSSRSAQIHSRFGYSRAPGAVIHNGYDPENFFPDEELRMATRRELGVNHGSFLIGCIARWNAQKDIPNLISAMSIGRNAGLPLHYILVGRDLDERNSELVGKLMEAGCRNVVRLLGERADVQSLARAIDLHVLPSCGGEAFPNVVAESMLSGTPNVVTDVGDTAIMIGDTGWLVEPNNATALAEAVKCAYHEHQSNPDRWRNRREAARKRIADLYTFEAMATAYEDVWRRAVEGRLSAFCD